MATTSTPKVTKTEMVTVKALKAFAIDLTKSELDSLNKRLKNEGKGKHAKGMTKRVEPARVDPRNGAKRLPAETAEVPMEVAKKLQKAGAVEIVL